MVRGSCSSWVVLTVWLLVTLPSVVQGQSSGKNASHDNSSNASGDLSGSERSGSGVQAQQPGRNNNTKANTATESSVIYECPLPWSGHAWTRNSRKTFEIVNRTSTRKVCRDVPVEEKKCSFSWSSTCMTDFSKCFTCYTIITGRRTVCSEEEILVQQLFLRDRMRLNTHHGYINPVTRGQRLYSPRTEIVWQLEAMERHRVYLQLTQIDLHNQGGTCSDYVEVSFNPCTPPTRICNSEVKAYTWVVSQRRMQVRFVSDHSKHTVGTGFKGAYYYYPVNNGNPVEDASRQLKKTKSLTSNTTERSRGKREVLKQLFPISMSAKRRAGSQAVTYHKSSLKDNTFPSANLVSASGSLTDGTHPSKFNRMISRRNSIFSSEAQAMIALGGKRVMGKEARSITEGAVHGIMSNSITVNVEEQKANS